MITIIKDVRYQVLFTKDILSENFDVESKVRQGTDQVYSLQILLIVVSITVPDVILGLCSRLDSTDSFRGIVPPTSM